METQGVGPTSARARRAEGALATGGGLAGPGDGAAGCAEGAAGAGWAPPELGREAAAPRALVSRIAWFALFAMPAVVIGIAATLTPDPAGHGTHTQLGLPPCGFLVITGVPCPGCGLTTAFANMTRLNIVGAAMANPFGVLLFMVSSATAVVALVGLWKGLPVVETLDRLHVEKWAILMAVTALLVWGVRVLTVWFG